MCLRLTWAPRCHGEDRNITDILRNLFLFSDHAPHCHYPGLMALLCERTEKRQPCSAQQGLAAILLFFNMVYNNLKYKKMSQVRSQPWRASKQTAISKGMPLHAEAEVQELVLRLTFLLDRHRHRSGNLLSLTPNRSTTCTATPWACAWSLLFWWRQELECFFWKQWRRLISSTCLNKVAQYHHKACKLYGKHDCADPSNCNFPATLH